VNAISTNFKCGPALFRLQLMMKESGHEAKTPDEINGQFDDWSWCAIMPQGTAAGPALPVDILLPRLAAFWILRTLCKLLQKDETFQEMEFRCQRIANVRDIAEEEHITHISINALARAFECPRSHVQSALDTRAWLGIARTAREG
jgi:hypothetical protein